VILSYGVQPAALLDPGTAMGLSSDVTLRTEWFQCSTQATTSSIISVHRRFASIEAFSWIRSSRRQQDRSADISDQIHDLERFVITAPAEGRDASPACRR
jgi:hypothetical protein